MAPNALDDASGMRREEIMLSRQVAIMESEQKMRKEFTAEVAQVRKEVQGLADTVAKLEQRIDRFGDGQETVIEQLKAVLKNQDEIKSEQALQREKVAAVSNLAITVEEETQDGRKIIKRFHTWKKTYLDVKGLITFLSSIGAWQLAMWILRHFGWMK